MIYTEQIIEQRIGAACSKGGWSNEKGGSYRREENYRRQLK